MWVHVAVGAVYRQGAILIARRHAHRHMGDRWELPGGKVEAGETPKQALTRELREEVAIRVTQLKPLVEIRHDYGDKRVLLDTWWVTGFDGEPRGAEGQEVRWVPVESLGEFRFPDANLAIIEAIRAQVLAGC
ncbi:8-oxo-dGTP diphosphatase MutT [Microbulbifer discodermiae]|uniref:8-oxo-dGTP diphosphatase MutT n=1 Tax=Microbulbifer sp. 2201CG32-9 TaxID=3232309 RepID=UPI00345C5A32